MSRAKRMGSGNNFYCKCSRASDGESRLSKKKHEYLRKIRTGVKERGRQRPQKVPKEIHLAVKKKLGAKPVKHYVNLPGWVVKNLIDICKKKENKRNKSKQKNPRQTVKSVENVKERLSQKNMENEQVPGEVMEIKREMATT